MDTPAPHEAFLGPDNTHVKRILAALESEGSCLMLTGEAGCGKAYLAQVAAYRFEAETKVPVDLIVAGSFENLAASLENLTPHRTSEDYASAIAALDRGQEKRTLLIVALRIDLYSAAEAAALESLVRSRQARLICTAQQITAAADRLARNPGVHQLAVTPLSLEETDAFLSRLLGVDHFVGKSLARWHSATEGNLHALLTLALAAERRGAVQRVRRVAWVRVRDDHAPIDFVRQLGELSPAERSTLELVSFAAPLHEPPLLQLLDSAAVTALIERQVLAVRTNYEGVTILTTRLPIVAASIRRHLSPLRRSAIAQRCFDALGSDTTHITLTMASRLRLARFGIESGRSMPTDWFWQAMRASARSGELRFELSLARASVPHENPQRAAEAIIRGCDLAHFLGDHDALAELLAALAELESNEARLEAVSFDTGVMLTLTAVCFDPLYRTRPEEALAALASWENRHEARRAAEHNESKLGVQAARMRLLSFSGRLRDAFEARTSPEHSHDLGAEIRSAQARTLEALLRVQRGEFSAALTLAETTRQLTLLHDVSPSLSGDLEGFVIFLAHWARGTTQAAEHSLEAFSSAVRADLATIHSTSGLVDLAVTLFTLQEGRWHDAVELNTRLTEMLETNDPFGVSALTYAASALAFAALGEDEQAINALQNSEDRRTRPGLSQALGGVLRTLTLRASHWLRDPRLAELARETADWARQEGLALTELEPLDVLAHETAAPDPRMLERAVELAAVVDAPIGAAILSHIRALLHDGNVDAEPEERLLAELGAWLPLPPVKNLTGRERQIALFTALGYSSKNVAQRLHLSARTVETHLSHVYDKLDITGRDQLRRWFSKQRECTSG